MNIFKTFEIFLREPLSILKERIIQIANVSSPLTAPSSVNVDLLDKKAQITVVNSDKMYNLLKTVLYKKEINTIQNLQIENRPKKMVLGQLCKRV